ncbi:Nitrilase-like protein 2 [Vitis vinifera]|uniref:Nitrilase-like protein 2 n=1 Tax=Vitis vinifera TaxID=29760 RepID=A0A438CC63_VITVI|nr:Nitrilase-like protein 2 [Vitis vinifera]
MMVDPLVFSFAKDDGTAKMPTVMVLETYYRKQKAGLRFDVDVPGGAVYKESSFTEGGKEVVAVDSPIGRLGVTVCYDLRFPELYQQLRFLHNAQVLLVPAAFTKVTGQAHWELLLRARAIETQCYVIAAAQAGKHNDKRESYGDSLIIDPWGTIIGRLPDRLSTGIAVADIDFSLIDSVRAKMPISQAKSGHQKFAPGSAVDTACTEPLFMVGPGHSLNTSTFVSMCRQAQAQCFIGSPLSSGNLLLYDFWKTCPSVAPLPRWYVDTVLDTSHPTSNEGSHIYVFRIGQIIFLFEDEWDIHALSFL